MVIMAGMLPGVESARRRRRVRQSSSSSGRDLGSSSSRATAASFKVWSGACGETTPTLGSDAREAKERLDHKLRGQRQPVNVVLKRKKDPAVANWRAMHDMRTRPPHDDAACSCGTGGGGSGSGSDGHHSATTTTACGVMLQREVVLPSSPSSSRPKKGGGGGCRFSWCRRLGGGRRGPPAAAETAEVECAVCLEELRAGDVVARLPCAHRFHWSCAVPWVQAVSRCPVCRAHVHVAAGTS